MYVTLTVTLGQQNNVFLIPQQALQRDTVGAYVLVVGPDGKVAAQGCQCDRQLGNDWIVTSGLAVRRPGDRVGPADACRRAARPRGFPGNQHHPRRVRRAPVTPRRPVPDSPAGNQ